MHSSSSSKSVMLENCAACSNSLSKKEYLRCVLCKSAYDLICLNMTSQRYRSFYGANSERKQTWKCPECLSKVPKQGNLTTPVRVNQSAQVSDSNDSRTVSSSPPDDNQNVTKRTKPTNTPAREESLLDESKDEFPGSPNSMTYVKTLAEELRAMRQELSRMCDKMDKFTDAVNTRMDRLEARMDSMESKQSEIEGSRIKELEETVSQLKIAIQDRDQETLGNDIEVASFPEGSNENTTHVIVTVAKKLGVELEERDVVNAQRAGPPPAAVEGGAPPRPRPLVVRLARRATRDALLRAARVRRGVTTEGIAQGSPRKFYVNERLTKENRRLFQSAREAAKRADWKFVWTRDGKIYARKDQGKASFRLRSDADIVKFFENSNVGSDSRNNK